ncbi:inner membrane protein YiaA [Deinococcus ficus]|uniref:inner membrane protein YiaA n=1 Tax=Deinococcus ficus TaxID=317577 RepID=UPI0003B67D15|nr:inner membrane protein YiaA [Deinococcus ficus]
MIQPASAPSPAFVAVSWAAVFIGMLGYAIGIWVSPMPLNSKGFYLVTLLYGLFAAISVQKSVRDRLEGIPVTDLYFGLCWLSVGLCLLLMLIGLWNAPLPLAEKGFYGMAYLLALFGAVAVQKNVRDGARSALSFPRSGPE